MRWGQNKAVATFVSVLCIVHSSIRGNPDSRHWQSPCVGVHGRGLEKFGGMLALILGNVLLIAWISKLYNTVLWMNSQAFWGNHFFGSTVLSCFPVYVKALHYLKAHLSEVFIITGGLLEGAFEIKLCFLSRCFSAGLWLSKVWDRPSVKSYKAPWRSPCTSLCSCPLLIYTCHTSPPFYTHFSAHILKLR